MRVAWRLDSVLTELMRVQFRLIRLTLTELWLNLCIFSEGCVQISLSSLGSGRVRPGFSAPWFLVCFRSSALGWYDPSICLLLRSTHENRTTARASRNNTGMNRPDTLAELMMLHTEKQTQTETCVLLFSKGVSV